MPNEFQGWVDDPRECEAAVSRMPHPLFSYCCEDMQDTGEGKTVLLYEFTKKAFGHHCIRQQRIGDCFVAGTIVSGERTKPIEDVKVGDRVYTANGNLTPVISTRSIETLKPLVKVHAVGTVPITCTEDHRFLVYRLGKYGKKRIGKPLYERSINRGRCDKVVSVYESRRAVWVKAGSLRKDDVLVTPIQFDRQLPQQHAITTTAEGWWLLGYFLGDGNASHGSVEFAVSDNAISSRLCCALRDHGYKPCVGEYRKDCGAWRVRVHSRELVKWIRREFYEKKVKNFPSWCVGNRDFLFGLQDADGQKNQKKNTIDSTSPSIAYGSYISLIQMGYDPTMTIVAKSRGSFPNGKPLRRVVWYDQKKQNHRWRDDRYSCSAVTKVERIEGPSVVYDIGVKDNHHSFLANGIAVHNCVSMGAALCVDTLAAVEEFLRGEPEHHPAMTATEPIYASSRVEVGRGRLGRGDGSIGAWAAEAVRTYGILLRKRYEIDGNVEDLSTYSGGKAKEWGMPRAGVPDWIEPTMREHLVRTTSLVTSYEEMRDAIANGYPVSICSNQGFAKTRDRDGFARARGSWAHCMAVVAVRDDRRRPGGLIQNSWGENWIGGPKGDIEIPDGSFWADADVLDRMLRRKDSFAFSALDGFKKRQDKMDRFFRELDL